MAFTLSTAKTEVRALINESTGVFWSDTEIENWIKEACTDISTVGAVVTDSQDVALVTNQLVYTSATEAWLTNVLKIYGCYYDDGSNGYKGLIRIHPRHIGNTDILSAGVPRYYCFFDNKFFVQPLPSASENAKNITVLHTKVTDDITALNYEHQKLAIKYATAMAYIKDRQYEPAGMLLQMYMNALNFEKDDKTEREVDSLDMFQIPKTKQTRQKETI
jgi:hypothetical protein